MAAFKIGINMAGAVSAGAYTAGVLDFLIQALDEWYAAKARGEAVPMHDVSIEVLSGASAGGMCAAIGGVSLHEQIQPAETMGPAPGSLANKLYRSWVEMVDIKALLGTADLKEEGPVVSVLDSTTLDVIASYALTPGARQSRKYVSNNLNLFLTVTNLRGTVYDINPSNGGAFEERIAYHADYLQFEVLPQSGAPQRNGEAEPLPLDQPADSPQWQRLQQTALASGAFPIVLAPRILERKADDYSKRTWTVPNPNPQSAGDCELETKITPDWGTSPPTTAFKTVNVDGGVTNNNPFELCRRFLADLKPQPPGGHNDRNPATADRAVITIAPFPGTDAYNPSYIAENERGIFRALGALVESVISQSRFSGESISLLKSDGGASRFVIAPSDEKADGRPALMCDGLKAFAGFLSRNFRDRDYQLGRRNCQWFLRQYFVLPTDNPVIADGINANRSGLVTCFKAFNDDKFLRPDKTKDYMPIIPLCGRAAMPIGHPGRQPMTESELKNVCGQATDRLVAVANKMLEKATWLVRKGIVTALSLGKGWIKGKLQELVMNDLHDSVEIGK